MSDFNPLRICFMGSPAFAIPTLNALVEQKHHVIAIYTQPPRLAGRGKVVRSTDVHKRANELGIEAFTPETLKSDFEQTRFASKNFDVAIVAAYGLLLPKSILAAPRLGCINVHASILPRWRGAAPIHRAIIEGDLESGISFMLMDEGLDTGPVIAKERIDISSDETAGSLHDKLSKLSADRIGEILDNFAKGELTPVSQLDSGSTYAEKITAADRQIDWTKPAVAIDRQIRGLSPTPCAWFYRTKLESGERIQMKAINSYAETYSSRKRPGTVRIHDNVITVACGNDSVIRILKLQQPNARAMEAADFLRGTPIKTGEVFS